MKNKLSKKVSILPDFFKKKDIALLKEGNHFQLYKKFGAHAKTVKGRLGYYFTVWAPAAEQVSVIGTFNQWKKNSHNLVLRDDATGIWEGFIAGVKKGDLYKYFVTTNQKKYTRDKTDPFSNYIENSHGSASIAWDLKYTWQDQSWLKKRPNKNSKSKNISIYEVHLGSWRRNNDEFVSYDELAQELVMHVKTLGFTHVEFLPITEHPYYGSWGYQSLGYFAPTSRYGTPQQFMKLIDAFHAAGIGVILDWVPAHFPSDTLGLASFDGTHLYETGEIHPDWKSYVFNLGSREVVDFLISNALFWIEKYHIDGIRVDAVASMLYLDYSRQKNEWQPNVFGGHENLESIAFLRELNRVIKEKHPGILLMAEESSAWPKVTEEIAQGGLGFDMKWNMGWMHDTLNYFRHLNKERSKQKGIIAHCLSYAFAENFLLPLSHDEVVHGKSSLLGKMPGKDSEKFSNLRCLFAFMFAHPGKKLIFMGAELAQWEEWNHETELSWDMLQYDPHKGIYRLIKDLNSLYRKEKALYESDFSGQNFQWVNNKDSRHGVMSFLRLGRQKKEQILVVCNFKNGYSKRKIGVPIRGSWKNIFNTDKTIYNGQAQYPEKVSSKAMVADQFSNAIEMNIPPLSIGYFKHV